MKLADHTNPEAERRCLSALMYGPGEVNAAVRDGLTADAFSEAKCRLLFRAIVASAAEKRATDSVTVWRMLAGMGGSAAGVTMLDVSDIEALEPTSMRRAGLVADVVGLWSQRKLVASLASALETASAPAPNWQSVWEVTEPHLRTAQSAGMVTHDRTIAEMAATAADRILNGDKRATISTGLKGWDQTAGPLRAGEMVVIGARPGAGKTAMAVQLAHHGATTSPAATAFFSLEMSGEELVTRMAASRAGADGIRERSVRANAALEVGKFKNLHLYDGPSVASIAQIEARARLLACSPSGIRAVFVDYLGLITPPPETRRENRERQVAELSRRFKLLAGELQCPVVVLSQLNRESEKDTRAPRLSDLRESGTLEQDADCVWFLYEEEHHNSAATAGGSESIVTLRQAKRRGGRANIETLLRFNKPLFQFTAANL